jgi:hypothetical protein
MDVDEHFATNWGGDLHLFEIEPATQRVQDECSHGATLR